MIAAIVVVGLVSYRVWRLLAVDSILERPRQHLFEPARHVLECAWCSGFWITGLVTLVAWQTGLTENPIWVWLASSVIVGFLGERS